MSRVRCSCQCQCFDVGGGVVDIHPCRDFLVSVCVGYWWHGAVISGAWIALFIDYF